MPQFYSFNLGCRANQADGAAIEQDLSQHGFQAVADPLDADVVVLNSCTVTAAADADLRQTVRRIHRGNPQARILVTGCYAQRCPEELSALPGVSWVVGNGQKTGIARLLRQEYGFTPESKNSVPQENTAAAPLSLGGAVEFHSLGSFVPAGEEPETALLPKILVGDIRAAQEFPVAPVVGGPVGDRTRPNLKIQDGCNNRCSFCIIPQVRGRSRSLPPAEVIRQVQVLCERGYREVVLSGINLGRYGRDLAERMRFAELVRRILDETPLERLRLSSVEPMDFTDELLDLMAASPRVAKHVHAPLQSGSDRILRRMYRKYHPWHYRARMRAAFERMPNAAFGADVMAGFPGETGADFEETVRFIESLPFTYLHVFPFSRRPGTLADTMADQIPGTILRERSRLLRELAAGKNLDFRQRQIGRTLRVLTLDEKREGVASALSDNFLRVSLPGVSLPPNELVDVRIVEATEHGLAGELLEVQLSLPRTAPPPSIMTCARA